MKHIIRFLPLIFILLGNGLFAQNNPNELFVNSFDGLNMRTAPSTSANKIKTLPFLTKAVLIQRDKKSVTIDGITTQWLQVRSGNDVGWVFGGYVSQISLDYKKLIGHWVSGRIHYVFEQDGSYSWGVENGGNGGSGYCLLSTDNKLYVLGKSEDEDGEYPDIDSSTVRFLDNGSIEFSYSNSDYKPVYQRYRE